MSSALSDEVFDVVAVLVTFFGVAVFTLEIRGCMLLNKHDLTLAFKRGLTNRVRAKPQTKA